METLIIKDLQHARYWQLKALMNIFEDIDNLVRTHYKSIDGSIRGLSNSISKLINIYKESKVQQAMNTLVSNLFLKVGNFKEEEIVQEKSSNNNHDTLTLEEARKDKRFEIYIGGDLGGVEKGYIEFEGKNIPAMFVDRYPRDLRYYKYFHPIYQQYADEVIEWHNNYYEDRRRYGSYKMEAEEGIITIDI